MKNLFNSIKVKKPGRNRFDLTHDVKLSGRMGNLMPVLAMEVVPGDNVKISADSIVRFAPLIAPVMHRFNATIHYFFVPNRLVWDNWESFITGSGIHSFPTIRMTTTMTADQKRMADYIGVPPVPPGALADDVNAIPFAAYQMIYNEFYRDQNLINPVNYPLIDGNNTVNYAELLTLRKRAWMHDYFSAALPFAQKGAEVDIPLGTVELDPAWVLKGSAPTFETGTGGHNSGPLQSEPTGEITVDTGTGPFPINAYNPDGSLIVGATTINELRRAERLQAWLEKMARGGSRYIEQIFAHFGVKSSDARLQRPEYICGVKSPVVISEVLNTTGENSGLPQGNMAGHAVSVGQGYAGNKFIEEHGFIIGIMSITPLPAYQQGIYKPFLPKTLLDYYWPEFAHLGEQEIKNKEIFAYSPFGDDTFGYIPRYAEYRYLPNRVAGDFRTSLDYWHDGRIFANHPFLNQEFIEVNPDADDLERIFAVTAGDDNLYIHLLNKIVADRPMPVYGTPML